jgi:hypothetical protein
MHAERLGCGPRLLATEKGVRTNSRRGFLRLCRGLARTSLIPAWPHKIVRS